MIFDLAVIGGGPAGYTAALEAVKEGLKVILFEKNYLGGTCLNCGCVPTKYLLHSSEVYSALDDLSFYGISIEKRKDFIYDDYQIDEEFIETVKEMLPAQPWQVGIHKTIAAQLGCPNAKVSRTIETLIDTGIFKKQINGQIIES